MSFRSSAVRWRFGAYDDGEAALSSCSLLLCFLGGNPENVSDLGAEISFCLGDEAEEYVINTATVISIPPGLKHGFIKVKKITRPIVFLEVSATKEYGEPAHAPAGSAEQSKSSKTKE